MDWQFGGSHDGMLRELFGVVSRGVAAENQAIPFPIESEVEHPASDSALNVGFQFVEA